MRLINILQETEPNKFWENILAGAIGALLLLIIQRVGNPLIDFLKEWFLAFGIGFKKRYLKAMAEEHGLLHLIGIRTKGRLYPPRLKDVFISLRLGKTNHASDSVISWAQIFQAKDERKIVILGDPGAGKTTLMDYLAYSFSEEKTHPLAGQVKDPMPIYVRLRDISDEKSLMSLVENTDLVSKTPNGYFERLLKKGKCVVLLDGLDEVLDQDHHLRVVKEIKQLTRDYPENWFIVTCRIAGWQDQLQNFRIYEVRPLGNEEIQKFIVAWYREVERSLALDSKGEKASELEKKDAERKALEKARLQSNALWRSLRKNSGLLKIARTPLILSLITLVHYMRQTELPKGRAKLYERCLDILLEEWDLEDKRMDLENRPSLGEKMAVLKKIAFHFSEKEILEMDMEELENLISPLIPNFEKKIEAKDLLQHIYERSGVLSETRIGQYGFAHRALQDYLTAGYIEENKLDALLLEHTGEEPWHEVIRIAVGLVKPATRAEKLLNSLLEKSRSDPYSLALAGWSLSEDVQISQKTRKNIKEHLLDALQKTEKKEDFARLHSALQSADPKSGQKWLRDALKAKDPALRQRVFNLLPEIATEEARSVIPILLSLSTDKAEAQESRVQALYALGGMKAEADAALWQALLALREGENSKLKEAATWAWCALGRYEELGLVKVPAGEFIMGEGKEQHKLYLPTFYMAKRPVSVDEYKQFVNVTQYDKARKEALKGRSNHPVNYVTWYAALAYAEWKGMTLPSEAEWEKAARGTDGRNYPWGESWKANHANTDEYWDGGRGIFAKLRRGRVDSGTTPIGAFSPQGDSPYGCVDMSGNLWEWTRSLHENYPYHSRDGREDLKKSGARVLRGGSFYNDLDAARCAVRDRGDPFDYWFNGGVRVVVSPFFIVNNSVL